MGYPAFHTRLIQVVEWARVIKEEGRSLAEDFFVPSKHVTWESSVEWANFKQF